ncbi:MAG: hypothetical protein C0467_03240 [Planctomycetaceae bacterium]|nr:hypothetical protein [Planctomycetaceae bacterium]
MFTTSLLSIIMIVAPMAPVPKERADAEKVVGTWKLVKSSLERDDEVALTIELTQGGKMTIRHSSNGVTTVYEGEYKIVKNEMPYSVKLPNGVEKKETLKIKKLTETELHVVDPDGIQEDFERVKPEKKKD